MITIDTNLNHCFLYINSPTYYCYIHFRFGYHAVLLQECRVGQEHISQTVSSCVIGHCLQALTISNNRTTLGGKALSEFKISLTVSCVDARDIT